jgi:hypothetical protein
LPYQRYRTISNVPAPALVGYALAGDVAWTHAVQIVRPDGTPIDAFGAVISFPDGYQGPLIWTSDYNNGINAQYVIENINPGTDEYITPELASNSNQIAAIYGATSQMTFGTAGLNTQVVGYAPGQSPGDQVLLYPAQKLVTDIYGNVSSSGGTGGGGTDWAIIERQQIRYILGMDGDKAAPAGAGPRLSDIYGYVNKLLFDGSSYVLADVAAHATGKSPAEQILVFGGQRIVTDSGGGVRVGAYATGLSPAEQVLAVPANRLLVDASGYVTASNAGGGGGTGVGDWTATELNEIRYVLGLDGTKTAPTGTAPRLSDIYTYLTTTLGPVRAKTDQLMFAGGFVRSEVDGYAAGMGPAAMLLSNPAARLGVDASGNVAVSAVTVAPAGLDQIVLDGLTLTDAIRGIAAACMGEIDYDATARTGTVSAPGNGNIIKIRYGSDDKMLSRTNVALTLRA